jgi:hypothetical protein
MRFAVTGLRETGGGPGVDGPVASSRFLSPMVTKYCRQFNRKLQKIDVFKKLTITHPSRHHYPKSCIIIIAHFNPAV